MPRVKKLDLGMTALDELFMNDKERAENKLPRIFDKYTETVRVFGDTIEREEYEYDEKGNCILKVEYEENAVCARTEYQYDETGNCILEIYYDVLQNQNTKTCTRYTPEGNLAEIQYFQEDEQCKYA